MNIRKVISLLIAAIFLISMLAACKTGDGGTETGGSTNGDQTSIADPTGIPSDLTFDGKKFKIITSPRTGDAYNEIYLDYEEGATDPVNEAVYKRNEMVQDRFDIEIEVEHSTSSFNVDATVKELVSSEEHVYDVAYISGRHGMLAALGGSFLDLNKLEYTNYEAPYWDKNCYEALSIGNKNFLMESDMSMLTLSGAFALFFNKQVMKDNGITDDIYQLVRDNEWTFEKMVEMSKGAVSENGDGVQNEKDYYGLFNLNTGVMMMTFGYNLVTKDENDLPQLFELTDGFETAFEFLRETGENRTLTFDAQTMISDEANVDQWGHIWDWTRAEMFGKDHIMFTYGGLAITSLFKDMTSDYGIVPAPKLTSEQDRYYCVADQYGSLFGVPATATDYEFIGAVSEYMAYVSTGTVREAYVETVLKNQRSRDEEVKEMINVIIDNIAYEPSEYYGLGIRDILYDAIKQGSLAQKYNKFSGVYAGQIEDIIESLAWMEE